MRQIFYSNRQFMMSLMCKAFLWMMVLGALGCSDFVEVDPPKNTLVAERVFSDPSTVESALANLYFSLREEGMVSGNSGFTTLLGIYADELDYYAFNGDVVQLYRHTVTPQNSVLLGWWTQGYQVIYAANDIIAGVESAEGLTAMEVERYKGQALFVRAYVHSLLVGVFGDIPYITTTDYVVNTNASRLDTDVVYEAIIEDLQQAVALMDGADIPVGDRVVPDANVARALLARMALYTQQWELAAATAGEVIAAFPLEPNLDQVFLKESGETIWQFRPGNDLRNTQEANQLVIQFIPGQRFALTSSLLDAFEEGDGRLERWTDELSDSDGTLTLSFAHKYKALFNETQSLEHSIVFRSAEQYLIRAEARAQLGNLVGARQDLNAVRNRAGLGNVNLAGQSELLEAIYRERRVELFAEQGLRWMDLKRTGRATEVMEPLKANWEDTHVLLPIPESELEINPNLLPQNPGY
ncbi:MULTISPECIES: RagB/SusD family nutrient uptake outer membrane protein [unclassified Allomuricauda]|uniref:RagB/SusD family nutrient uptake outer membrane protein n=1 Tax=unclassified Allomuricauda TaxID=2615049 RepID=UPI00273DB644|nr:MULTISPECIES: RagB/SusD family nutrient uptake outer membrane protein [unclassified Allomuricauda]